MVYLINLARHDPAAYQVEQNLPVDLSYVTPRAPLAVNQDLFDSAAFHAEEMATHNYFGHQSQVTGDWPNKMARDEGYALPSWYPNDKNYIESIAAGYATPQAALNALIVDEGWEDPGHRKHLLGIDEGNAKNREIGVGYGANQNSKYKDYWAIHATLRNEADAFLTGVVYRDANGNGRYNAGEGLGGVTITVGAQKVTTNEAGGWSAKVLPGQYTVEASGGAFAGIASSFVTVASASREVDFISGQSSGIVDFETGNKAPVARDDFYLVAPNGVLDVPAKGLLANDSDPNQDPLTAVLVSNPGHGTLSLDADGSFRYTPQAGFRGTDRFTYRVRDDASFSYNATATITVAQSLGTVDFLPLADQTAIGGQVAYRFRAFHTGTLTAQLTSGAGSLTLSKLDDLGRLQTLRSGTSRLDYTGAVGGQEYFLVVSGLSGKADLRLANQVRQSGSSVYVFGTTGDDQFVFQDGASRAVTVNGVRYQFTPQQAAAITFDSGLGDDRAVLTLSSAAENVALEPGQAAVRGAGLAVNVRSASEIFVNGAGGNDVAVLRGSEGDDTLTLTPGEAKLAGPGFTNTVRSFPEVYGDGRGGADTAYLSGSAGDDVFTAASDRARLVGPGLFQQIAAFENIHANGGAGRNTARFYDSAGNDTFIGKSTYGELNGSGYMVRAKLFDAIYASSTAGGTDVAYLHDTVGDAAFTSTSGYAQMTGQGYLRRATGFGVLRTNQPAPVSYPAGSGTGTMSLHGIIASAGIGSFSGSCINLAHDVAFASYYPGTLILKQPSSFQGFQPNQEMRLQLNES